MPIDLSTLNDDELQALSVGDRAGWARTAAAKHNVPEYLIDPIIQQESGGKQSAVSPKGATGIMQLMPGTAKSLGVNPKDWAENIWGGMKYLGEQLKAFGSPEEALAAYNAGPGAVKKYKGVPPYKETKGYVRNITRNIDVTKMSDEELERLAGGQTRDQSPEIDVTKMTDAELEKLAGTAPSALLPPGTPASVGIEHIPGAPKAPGADVTSDTLAQFADPAGEMVGKAMDLPFVPLRKGLEYLHQKVIEPQRERTIQEWADAMKSGGALEGAGAAAPEAFAALPSKETFVPTMEMALSVPYLKMISKGIGLLNEVGGPAFRRNAPDIFFKYTAKGGLPVPLSPDQVAEKLMAMTGTERAAMVKKYPQFRDVMQEMAGAAETKAMAPEVPRPTTEVPPKPPVMPPAAPKLEPQVMAPPPQPPPQPPVTPPVEAKPGEPTPTPTITPPEKVQQAAAGEVVGEPKPPIEAAAKEPLGVSQVDDINAPSFESFPDATKRDIQYLSDLTKTKSFSKQGLSGLDVPTQRSMLSKVVAILHEPQIREAIINRIPVDVVNNLARQKSAANVVLHDKNVLPESLAINRKTTIPIRMDVADSLIRSIARLTAKKIVPVSKIGKSLGKDLVAKRTSEFAPPMSEQGETPLRTKKPFSSADFKQIGVLEEPISTEIATDIGKMTDRAHEEPPKETVSQKILDSEEKLTPQKGVRKQYSFPGIDTPDLIKLATPGLEAGRDMKQGIQSLVLPTAKSKEHYNAAVVLGSKLGSSYRRSEQAGELLEKDSRMFDKMGVHDPDVAWDANPGYKFASDMSMPGRTMEPKMQTIADKVEKGFAVRLRELEKADAPLENLREAYFPGMWTQESRRAFNQAVEESITQGRGLSAAEGGLGEPININEWSTPDKTWVRNRVNQLLESGQGSDKDYLRYLARRPFKGSESFRKAKVFDDWGTAIEFGLRPVSNNPLDLVKLKYAEMDRSILANQALREWELTGDVVNTDNSGRPLAGRKKGEPKPPPLDRSEWRKIKDRYGEIWMRDPETHLLSKVGERWAKIPVADVMNNYLSTSLYNSPYFGKAYTGLMAVGNSLNQSQLGWGSMFHAGFTTIEAQISAGAEVLKDIYGLAKGNRTLKDLGTTVAKFPVAFARSVYKGNQALKEWHNPIMDIPTNVPVTQILDMAPNQGGIHEVSNYRTRSALITKAYELGGGRTTMDKYLRTHQTDKMIRDWYGGAKFKAALRSPIALSEFMMKPIMIHLVPRQKLGVFGELAGRIIEQNPSKTLEQLRPEFRQAVNRVDARLGQVGYERLFINNVAKNAIQGLIRSPGWSGGTIAEVGGAGKDAATFIKDWAKTGEAPNELPDRVAYTIALLGTTFAVNSLLTYGFTGEKPWESKTPFIDMWAFRDGGKDKYGNPTRWLLPSYAKDIHAYWQNWEQTLINKTHPVISSAHELWKGVNYYNEQFVDPQDNFLKRQWDRLKHVPQFYEPFWTRGMRKAGEAEGGVLETLQKSPGKIIAPEIGVMPAPRAYTQTNADKLVNRYFEMQGHPIKTPKMVETGKEKQKILDLFQHGKTEEAQAELKKSGLTRQQKKNLQQKAANIKKYLFNQVRDLDVAVNVYNVATPEEKAIYGPALKKKINNLRDRDYERYKKFRHMKDEIQTDESLWPKKVQP